MFWIFFCFAYFHISSYCLDAWASKFGISSFLEMLHQYWAWLLAYWKVAILNLLLNNPWNLFTTINDTTQTLLAPILTFIHARAVSMTRECCFVKTQMTKECKRLDHKAPSSPCIFLLWFPPRYFFWVMRECTIWISYKFICRSSVIYHNPGGRVLKMKE